MTYKIDIDILPLDLHAKIQVPMSVSSAAIARRTDGQTPKRCQNYYTQHVRDVGCNKKSLSELGYSFITVLHSEVLFQLLNFQLSNQDITSLLAKPVHKD